MDPASVARALTPRSRAIVPVHTYGNVCAMDALLALGQTHGVAVIEDAAEAFPSRYRGRVAGTLGTLGCYSFQATKTITTGEGGMVVTEDAQLFQKMGLYRSHGMGARRYWHEVPGHNFRLTNLQAALGCAQLEGLDEVVLGRRRVHAQYRRLLQGQRGLSLQCFAPEVDGVLWAMACLLDEQAYPQGRDAVMAQLARAGIETRPGFYPASVQPIYTTPPLPVCEAVSRAVVSLPTFPHLEDRQIARICEQLLALRAGGR